MGRKTTTEPAPAPAAPMKVQATRLGYYGEQRRRPGDVFPLAKAQDFASTWMVEVPPETPDTSLPPSAALRKIHAALMQDKTPMLQKNAADLEPEDEDELQPTGAADVLG